MLKKLLNNIGFGRTHGKNSSWLKELIKSGLDTKHYNFLPDAEKFINALSGRGARFYVKDGKLMVQVHGLAFFVNSWEELFILHEVFIEGTYDVELVDKFALIDIGMNVGITSLYFANKPNCEVIFAYEPFQSTIDSAKRNLALNSGQEKIHIINQGLGYPERTTEIVFSEVFKGSVGIAAHQHVLQQDHTETRNLHIKDVYESLSKNINEYKGKFLVKIDSEGTEYEIIERLEQTGILSRVHAYMIEWHNKGAAPLKNIFLRNKFTVIDHPAGDGDQRRGMLYAINAK